MDPDGGVEQNVVTQLLEQQDAILQVAKVSGKGQHNVQDRPRHMHLGWLERRQGDKKCHNRRWKKREDDISVKGYKDGESKEGWTGFNTERGGKGHMQRKIRRSSSSA